MFVEVIGLPGSGKTTLIKGCYARLKANGHRVMHAADLDDLDKKNQDMPNFVRRSSTSRAMYRAHSFELEYSDCVRQIRNVFKDEKNQRAMTMAAAVRQQIASVHKDDLDLVLVDEGMLHRFIAVLVTQNYIDEPILNRFCHKIIKLHRGKRNRLTQFCRSVIKENRADKKIVAQFCESMPFPEAMVFINIAARQSQDRVQRRLAARISGQTRLMVVKKKILAAYGDIEYFKRRRALLEHAMVQLEKRGCNIIRVPNSNNPQAAQNFAVGELDRLIKSTRNTQVAAS